jgi:hypothetical protein
MSFFDQKEDVLQVEMTPYGKYLYSIGKFSPAYYSFHDNDIIYDIAYADDRTEYPSESFPRIVQDCLYLKPQARFKSVEKTKKTIEVFNTLTDNDLNGAPIGTSTINGDYKPAWSINALKGVIDTFQQTYTNSDITSIEIPQINLQDITLTTEVIKQEDAVGVANQSTYIPNNFNDGNFLQISDEYVLFSVEEKNVDVLKENFEIEIFEVSKENGVDTRLKQIFFQKPVTNIINNILIDDKDLPKQNIDQKNILVDNYFEITFDKDIELIEDISQVPSSVGVVLTNPPYGENC